MHLLHDFDDCTSHTLPPAPPLNPRALMIHRANKSLEAGRALLDRADRRRRLLPPGLLTGQPLTRDGAMRLSGFLGWLRSYYGMIREKLAGYEYGDFEYDTLHAERRTMEGVREALIRAELIPAAWLLAEPATPWQCSITTPATPADICHGREARV